MTIDRAALVDALSEAFSEPHGKLAAALMAQLPPSQTIDLLTTGKVAAAVLAEVPETLGLAWMDAMGFVGADLTLDGVHTYLDAAAVAARPDVAPYVAWTAGDQMAMAISAAYPDPIPDDMAPEITGVAAVQIGNDLHGFIADLRYARTGGVATLHFGNRLGASERRTMREVSGGFLSGIGVHLNQNGADPFAMPGVKPVALSAGATGAIH
jgi:hypothetical protein